jgi:hypothetical protein
MKVGSRIDAVEVHLQVSGPGRGGGQQESDQKSGYFTQHGLLLLIGVEQGNDLRKKDALPCRKEQKQRDAQALCFMFRVVNGVWLSFIGTRSKRLFILKTALRVNKTESARSPRFEKRGKNV